MKHPDNNSYKDEAERKEELITHQPKHRERMKIIQYI
jgi:hypothetical protein